MDAFIGEIRLMPYFFVPQGWLACDGTIYPIQQYQPLFALLGATYGGNGQSTFAVPNLQSRTAVGIGDDPVDPFDPSFGEVGGAETEALSTNQVPSHTHSLNAANVAATKRQSTAAGNLIGPLSTNSGSPIVNAGSFGAVPAAMPVTLSPFTLSPFAGGSQAHENRQPYLAMQYCICWDGTWPPRP